MTKYFLAPEAMMVIVEIDKDIPAIIAMTLDLLCCRREGLRRIRAPYFFFVP